MANLYQLSSNYQNLLTYLDQDDIDIEMINDTLESIKDEIEIKVENIIKFMKNIEGDIQAFKAEEKRLADRRKSLENLHDKLKQNIFESMQRTQLKEVKAGVFQAKLQRSNPSVEIVDEERIPKKYKIDQQPKVDRKSLLEDLKNGVTIEGANLITNKEHLRIR